MKLLLLTIVLFLVTAAQAQTYAPYTGNKANSTTVSKQKLTKNQKSKPVVSEKASLKEESELKGDFEDFMNKAVEQLHQKDYLKAEGFYTQALEVSTEKNAWRAWLSRATLYAIMKEDSKAIKDLSLAIENKATPKTQLAIMYATRARIQAANKKMNLACADVAKAKALGISERLIADIDCK